MGSDFRQSMNAVHTWAGVTVGALLFAIFWMGTLSVFDREIDRWMMPMTRLSVPDKPLPFETMRPTYEDAARTKAAAWTVLQTTERQPVMRVVYREAATRKLFDRYFDPTTGAALPDHETLAGSRFLYRFHYTLHLRMWHIGEWIVGIAAMAMLVLCISGVVTHRRLIADFFMFRRHTPAGRTMLDLHTVAGGIGLPFYVMISLSGLFIHFAVYFPSGYLSSYENQSAFNMDAVGGYSRPKSGSPGKLASLDAMAGEARTIWNGAEPWAIVVHHPGDASSYVTVFQSFDAGIARYSPAVHFDAATGKVLHVNPEIRPVLNAQRFFSGMHQIQFRHWTLRFLYFGLGLLGSVLILTGLLYWLERRRKRHAIEGRSGFGIVRGLVVGSTAGIIAATASFFVINRLLPLGTTAAGIARPELEVVTFYIVWIATFTHAWLRPGRAWIEQCWIISILAVAAVALNWITTGDHLVRSLMHPQLWAVAGTDLMLLLGAGLAMYTARKLGRASAGARVFATSRLAGAD